MSENYKSLVEMIDEEVIPPLGNNDNNKNSNHRSVVINQLYQNCLDLQTCLDAGDQVTAKSIFHEDYPMPLLSIPQDKWPRMCRLVHSVAEAGELPGIIERLEFLKPPSGSHVPPNVSTPCRRQSNNSNGQQDSL